MIAEIVEAPDLLEDELRQVGAALNAADRARRAADEFVEGRVCRSRGEVLADDVAVRDPELLREPAARPSALLDDQPAITEDRGRQRTSFATAQLALGPEAVERFAFLRAFEDEHGVGPAAEDVDGDSQCHQALPSSDGELDLLARDTEVLVDRRDLDRLLAVALGPEDDAVVLLQELPALRGEAEPQVPAERVFGVDEEPSLAVGDFGCRAPDGRPDGAALGCGAFAQQLVELTRRHFHRLDLVTGVAY